MSLKLGLPLAQTIPMQDAKFEKTKTNKKKQTFCWVTWGVKALRSHSKGQSHLKKSKVIMRKYHLHYIYILYQIPLLSIFHSYIFSIYFILKPLKIIFVVNNLI